jgi:hypothetical protein
LILVMKLDKDTEHTSLLNRILNCIFHPKSFFG